MAVTLREKKLVGGNVSLYLDITHNGKRWPEFLNIHIHKKKPTPEDTEKKRIAQDIRSKREHELIVSDHGLTDKKGKRADFVKYMVEFFSQRAPNGHRTGTLYQLRLYLGDKSLPIAHVNAKWLKEFEKFLLKTLKTTSVMTYMRNINSVLNEMVRKQIIPRNPWHEIPQHERMKVKESMRTCWTIEQLQQLANTPCSIEPQYKQAYFFACFTGLRWSDVNKLQWSNIIRRQSGNQTSWLLNFEQQKTESVEYFPLSDQAIEILKDREGAQAHSVYVFPKVKETDLKNHTVHQRVYFSLKKWAKAAGLDHAKMRFHTGRHSFATNLLETTDIFVVSKLLGHKNVKTTQIYTQVRDKMKEEAIRTLPTINLKGCSFHP